MAGRPPGVKRKVVNFSLPIELISKLQEYSEETMIPQSRIVEKAIKEYIERQQPDRDKMQ